MVKKLSQLYLDARRALLAAEEPRHAAFLARNLACHVTGKNHAQLLRDGEMYVGDGVCQVMDALVARVLSGEPLAYILQEWEFYGLKLHVDNRVLIPRDDTCAVTALAIQYALFLKEDPRILDLCTGSGCIGLAVASRVPDARITLADISRDALAVAKKNTVQNRLTGRVSCVTANALEPPSAFLGRFDMIVSNPPYITTREMEDLPSGVRDFEPHLALHGGADGLDFYRAIAENYRQCLKPGGCLCFEFGLGQADAVCRILETNGYTILERSRDYNDRERAVIARYNRKEE